MWGFGTLTTGNNNLKLTNQGAAAANVLPENCMTSPPPLTTGPVSPMVLASTARPVSPSLPAAYTPLPTPSVAAASSLKPIPTTFKKLSKVMVPLSITSPPEHTPSP